MDMFLMWATAILLVAAAVYAHKRIPRFTAGRRNVAVVHLILILVGAAAGGVGAVIYRDTPVLAFLSLLIGFGVVHVPAAIILFFKQAAHSQKT